MNRSVKAFVVAPLWGPVVVAPCSAIFLFPHLAQGDWVVITTVVSAIFTYGGMLAFGLPAFLILRSRQLTDLWIAAVLGFVFGAVTWIIFLVCFALSLGEGIAGARLAFHSLHFATVDVVWLFAAGLLGLIIGVTFWHVAGPDRDEPRLL